MFDTGNVWFLLSFEWYFSQTNRIAFNPVHGVCECVRYNINATMYTAKMGARASFRSIDCLLH